MRALGADIAYKFVASAFRLAVNGGAHPVELSVSHGNIHFKSIRRIIALQRFEWDDGQPEQLSFRYLTLMRSKGDHFVFAIMREIKIDHLGYAARSKDNYLAHTVSPCDLRAEKGATKKPGNRFIILVCGHSKTERSFKKV